MKMSMEGKAGHTSAKSFTLDKLSTIPGTNVKSSTNKR